MSLTLDPVSDSLTTNGNDDKPADAATPVAAAPPNDEHVDEILKHEGDASRQSLAPEEDETNNDLQMEDASVVPQVDSVQDPSGIPVDSPNTPPPTGELLPDVEMAEQSLPSVHTNGINGTNGDDVQMSEPEAHSPPVTPAVALTTPEASTSYLSPKAEADDEGPPAKRPRVHSDADRASLANSATPPPASADTQTTQMPPPTPSSSSHALTNSQYRFMSNCIKSLKKQKDAAPFLRPVDPVALNVPHYPTIITHPMDLGTIDRKVALSNPSKPDNNPSNPHYADMDEFVSDVHLVFSNCYKFNGPEHAISSMAKRVEEVFDRQIKNMPTATEPPVIKKPTPPLPPPPAHPKKASQNTAVRRASQSGKAEPAVAARPKREIHPLPPKEPYVESKKRKTKQVDALTAKQLQYCGKIITEIFKKQHYEIASPFYHPVDWVKLDIPSYPKLIKKPMDLSTIKRKLETGEYANAQRFADDFKLMIRNCFTFNPTGTPVSNAGMELQRLFDNKWKLLPEARERSDDDDDDEEGSEDDHNRAIQELESQMKAMSENLAALKTAKAAKEKRKRMEKIAKQQAAQQQASSSRPPKAPKPAKKASGSKSKKAAATEDDGALSFSQKKDLSEAIQQLDGVKLEKVIKIIHEGFPEIRDSTEEIEIEIDRLPAPVLTKLYNFVIRPQRPVPGKRSRHGKGTGTGGLKRKSMDEDVEAEKIRQLEQRMQLFDHTLNGGALPPAGAANAAGSDSDSSSGSDSSASDSE